MNSPVYPQRCPFYQNKCYFLAHQPNNYYWSTAVPFLTISLIFRTGTWYLVFCTRSQKGGHSQPSEAGAICIATSTLTLDHNVLSSRTEHKIHDNLGGVRALFTLQTCSYSNTPRPRLLVRVLRTFPRVLEHRSTTGGGSTDNGTTLSKHLFG